MRLKWKVGEAPTGPYRSFHKRSWPSAYHANGWLAASISCEDPYEPSRAKTGAHAPLTVWVFDYSLGEIERKRWRVRGNFATLEDAKNAAALCLQNHPHFLPKTGVQS